MSARHTLDRRAVFQVNWPAERPAWSLLAPYDLTIKFEKCDWTVTIGRYSLSSIARILLFPSGGTCNPLTIGSFCEISSTASIICGGDHRNESLFNVTSFGTEPSVMRLFMGDEDSALADTCAPRPIHIDHNVVISAAATVLGGATIGRGCVIGAGSVVTGECREFGIYAKNPLERIKDRFDAGAMSLHRDAKIENVAVHSMPKLPTTLRDLQSGAISIDAYLQRITLLSKRPRIEIIAEHRSDNRIVPRRPVAFFAGYERITGTKHDALMQYFDQVWSHPSGTIKWVADVFDALDLY